MRAPQVARFAELAGCSKTGNFAFDERPFHAADAGRLAGAVDVWRGRALEIVGRDETVFDPAAKQHRQLEVGDEVKSAGEVVAGNLPLPGAASNGYGSELTGAVRRDRPTAGEDRHTAGGQTQTKSLNQFRRLAGEMQSEGKQAKQRGLFENAHDVRATLSEFRSHSQQQRTAAGDEHALALER